MPIKNVVRLGDISRPSCENCGRKIAVGMQEYHILIREEGGERQIGPFCEPCFSMVDGEDITHAANSS